MSLGHPSAAQSTFVRRHDLTFLKRRGLAGFLLRLASNGASVHPTRTHTHRSQVVCPTHTHTHTLKLTGTKHGNEGDETQRHENEQTQKTNVMKKEKIYDVNGTAGIRQGLGGKDMVR